MFLQLLPLHRIVIVLVQDVVRVGARCFLADLIPALHAINSLTFKFVLFFHVLPSFQITIKLLNSFRIDDLLLSKSFLVSHLFVVGSEVLVEAVFIGHEVRAAGVRVVHKHVVCELLVPTDAVPQSLLLLVLSVTVRHPHFSRSRTNSSKCRLIQRHLDTLSRGHAESWLSVWLKRARHNCGPILIHLMS